MVLPAAAVDADADLQVIEAGVEGHRRGVAGVVVRRRHEALLRLLPTLPTTRVSTCFLPMPYCIATDSVADAAPPPPPRPAAPRSRARPPASAGASSSVVEVKCKCGVVAAERTVTKESNNKGRRFWTCGTSECEFFEWCDGPSTNTTSAAPRTRSMPAPVVPAKRSYSTESNVRRSGP